MSELRRGSVDAGGASSRLIEAGPRERAEAVVFVHGNPGSCTDWEGLVAATGEFARAVAFDMPGFGATQAPAGFAYDIAAYASFIAEALAALGIERAHLVLHDFGGPFGMAWGLDHPDAWASVVLFNIGVMPGYRWHSMARRWRTPVLGELVQAWIPRFAWRRAMAAANPKGLPAGFVDKMYDEYDRKTRRTVLALYRATPDPASTAAEVGPRLAELRRPALVVWGAKDPYVSPDYAERQREFFDVERVVVLPESGHWAFRDDPQAAAEAVLPFLRERLAA
ncbi:MAG TPA: alpha/beta hydrolase [Solirubrobacteraceae bacterium]|nr:alpha/beta hydrolase [Solirubrobacteraceae bacterium]